MKNSIKLITILGIVTFCFSVYPMEVEPYYYVINPSTLRGTNPLFRTFCAKWEDDDHKPVPLCHSLHEKGEGLPLILTAVKIFHEPDNVKNEETLQTVRDSVRDGISVTSRFVSEASKGLSDFYVFFRENPTSIFTSVDDLFENQLIGSSGNERVYKKRRWLEAVFQGYRERRENRDDLINYMCTLEKKVSKILISLIVLYLPEYYVDEEETELINQAKEKFDEEQQLQLSLDKDRSQSVDLIDTQDSDELDDLRYADEWIRQWNNVRDADEIRASYYCKARS